MDLLTSRRQFVARAGGASAATFFGLGGELGAQTPEFAPKVNGGINLHPLRRFGQDANPLSPVIVSELVALQVRLAYEWGFDSIRITTPFSSRGDFLAALAYVRVARAVGLDVVAVLSDFAGLGLARALTDSRKRAIVLRLYLDLFGPTIRLSGRAPAPGRLALQILNEPAHFLGVPPDFYVSSILRPAFEFIRSRDPLTVVVAAAEVGNQDGPERFRSMLEAGLETSCDRVAYHVYSRAALRTFPRDVQALGWVTETGVAGGANQLPWAQTIQEEIRIELRNVSKIFHYDLFDPEIDGYRAIAIEPTDPAAVSGFQARVESRELVAWWTGRVGQASSGVPALRFDDLVPDLAPFLPTESDVRAYDAAVRG